MRAAAFEKLGAEARHWLNRRGKTASYTPTGLYKQPDLQWEPRKGSGTSKIGGAENREQLDTLPPHTPRFLPLLPEDPLSQLGQKTRALFFGESNIKGLWPGGRRDLRVGKQKIKWMFTSWMLNPQQSTPLPAPLNTCHWNQSDTSRQEIGRW